MLGAEDSGSKHSGANISRRFFFLRRDVGVCRRSDGPCGGSVAIHARLCVEEVKAAACVRLKLHV